MVGTTLSAEIVEIDGWELVLFERAEAPIALPKSLTVAEHQVAHLLLAGSSPAQIAAVRGSRIRTVSNQIGSIYRKLGVCSRTEQGHSNKVVAADLGIAATTVATHLRTILRKLDLRDRMDLVRWYA